MRVEQTERTVMIRSMHVLDDMTILLEADGPLQSWLDQAGVAYTVENRADFQPNL
ncbi:MAG TPA: hypothetical protein V6C81_23975 [Planktothrix sp.]